MDGWSLRLYLDVAKKELCMKDISQAGDNSMTQGLALSFLVCALPALGFARPPSTKRQREIEERSLDQKSDLVPDAGAASGFCKTD